MQSEFFTTIKAIYGVESKPRSSATVPNLCDFDFNVFHQDLISSRDELTKIAVDNGVKWFVAPGTTLKDSEDLLTMSHSDERFFCTAGIHPYNAEKEVLSESSLSSLDSLVKRNNCLGVGECGLDFSDGFPEISYQIQWFRAQIALSILHQKPLYLHVRLACAEFLDIMSSYGFGENLKPPVECCIHCFTGTTIDLATYRLWGFYIGLTGYIFSIPDNTLLEWLHIIGIDRLVIETDAPYMGFKGCRARQPTAAKKNYPNVPSALPLILDRICSVSSWNRNEVAMKTTRNVADFFRVSLD